MRKNGVVHVGMAVLLVLTGILLIASPGCGRGATTTVVTGYSDFTVTSTLTEGHTHDFIILGEWLEDPPLGEKTMKSEFIAGYAGPLWHEIILTQEDFVTLVQGGTVIVETNGAPYRTHTHQVFITYPGPLPE